MPECYIYDSARTPRGRGRKRDGALAEATPLHLASTSLQAIRDRNELDTALVDDVVLGCVEPVGEQGANIGRLAALYSGYSESVPGVQLHRFCASGLDATNMAAAQIKAGVADLTIGGGVESMSRIAMGAAGGAWSTDPQLAWDTHFVPQGISADLIATKYGFTREAVDAYAVESQKRAAASWKAGNFDRSVVPVVDQNGATMLATDEHMRPGTTVESLASLRPSFQSMGENYGFNEVALQRYPEIEAIEHIHHAGNSSGIVDGSAAILLGTKEMGTKIGVKPRARIVTWCSIGSDPCIMLTGPAASARKALGRAKMGIGDIDLYEINEAFAAVVLLFMQEMELSLDKVNVAGGAIAMGHPLGATGAMLVGTVLDELERRDLNTALVTLCVGAGMGTATIIERV